MSTVIDEAVKALNEKMGGAGFDGVAKFVIEDEGAIIIDGDGARAGDDEAEVEPISRSLSSASAGPASMVAPNRAISECFIDVLPECPDTGTRRQNARGLLLREVRIAALLMHEPQ